MSPTAKATLIVALGSGAGGALRFLVSAYLSTQLGSGFPFGTLTINVVGSFLLSLITFAGGEANVISPSLRLALGAGVMGGFTTYSTFSGEAVRLASEGAVLTAAAYVTLTVVGGLLATALGLVVAKLVWA